MKIVERALKPDFCFKAGKMASFADDVSATFRLTLSHVPFVMASLLHSSS
jgi:hypothetical protein